MLEVCVAAVDEALGWTRKKTTMILTGFLLIITVLPALSYSAAKLSVYGIPLLDVMDETVGTLGLHIAAILLAVAFTWFLSLIYSVRTGYSNAPNGLFSSFVNT